MSNKMGGGQGAEGKVVSLSAHRCPEVDLLPHRDADAANKLFNIDNTSRTEQNYMDLSPTFEEEEEEGISDWPEKDLSPHFSSSVDLLSDGEDSGPEGSFECVDVSVETQVNGEKNESKMVPKRQIHLRKKKDADDVINQETTNKPELALNDGSVVQEKGNSHISAYHCPPQLLRQQSTPISSTTSSDVISCGVYRSLTREDNQGLQAGMSQGQRRLQKSFSLDKNKTKMASCVIRNVLLKKMQVEQKSSDLKNNAHVLPTRPPVTKEQTGVVTDLVSVMGDDRVSIKKTCSFSFPMETTTSPNHRFTCIAASGHVGGHSSTYQEVLGFKGQTTALLTKFSDRKQSNTYYCPILQQRRSCEPMTSKVKVDGPPISQSKKAAGESHPLSLLKPTTSRLSQQTQILPSVQEQTSSLGVSSRSAPGSSQTINTCFYKSPTLHPHMNKISYVHSSLSPSQTQVQPTQPATTRQLHTRSQDQIQSATKPLDQIMKVSPPYVIKSTDEEEYGGKDIATTQQQPQQQFVCSIQSFLPKQVCGNVPTSSQGDIFSGTVYSHVPIDLTSRQLCYVDMPPQLETKMLLDPETGQFVQVFLPRDSSSLCSTKPTPTIINPSSLLIHTASAHPTSAVLHMSGANLPMSIMQLQPMAAVTSIHLPFTLHMPTVYRAQ